MNFLPFNTRYSNLCTRIRVKWRPVVLDRRRRNLLARALIHPQRTGNRSSRKRNYFRICRYIGIGYCVAPARKIFNGRSQVVRGNAVQRKFVSSLLARGFRTIVRPRWKKKREKKKGGEKKKEKFVFRQISGGRS